MGIRVGARHTAIGRPDRIVSLASVPSAGSINVCDPDMKGFCDQCVPLVIRNTRFIELRQPDHLHALPMGNILSIGRPIGHLLRNWSDAAIVLEVHFSGSTCGCWAGIGPINVGNH